MLDARASRRRPKLRKRHRRALRRAGWLLVELLIVFAGVYAAFLLNAYREDRRDAERREQLTGMFADHIAGVNGELGQARTMIDSVLLRPIVRAPETGERPLPRPLDFASGDVGAGLWEAALQAGGLDVLDLELVQRLQLYFARLQFLDNVAIRTRALSDTYLIPRLGEGPTAFYDPRSGALRPEFRWYVDNLRLIGRTIEEIVTTGDSLRAVLQPDGHDA